MSILAAANALAWVAILLLSITVLALARQIGVLHERIAPMGALTMPNGPKPGDVAPIFDLIDIATGNAQRIGGATGRAQLVFFLSTTCPVCKKLLPILRAIAADEKRTAEIVLASDGEISEHKAFYQREKLAPFPFVLSAELGLNYHVSRLPFGVVIGPDGRLAAKGLVNNREQIESLLLAQEMGVASVQEFFAGSVDEDRKHAVV